MNRPLWRALAWAILVDAIAALLFVLVCSLTGCSGAPGPTAHELVADGVVLTTVAAAFVIARRS